MISKLSKRPKRVLASHGPSSKNRVFPTLVEIEERKAEVKPFMIINCYFGEFGIFEQHSVRRWTVIAKKKTVVYQIPREVLLNKVLLEP